MSVESKILKSEQGMTVSGKLVFANVSDLLEESNQHLNQSQNNSCFVIDCTKMERIDSAGIALLLEWQRQKSDGNKNNVDNKGCRFEGLPAQAQALIEAYRLQPLISA